MPTLPLLVGAAVAVVVIAACCAPGARAKQAPLEQSDLLRGTNSAILEPRLAIARDAESWKTLWEEHARLNLPTPPAPEVDFEQSMVVAVFLGQRPSGGYAVEIESCTVQDDELHVRRLETVPGQDAVTMALTAPFHMVTVPQTEGTPVLELEVAGE